MSRRNAGLSALFLSAFLVSSLFALTNLYAAPPSCPGHPSCKDDESGGTVQLGSGDDIWPDGVDNSGDDTVFGGAGNDVISGGDGNDNLQGQAGDDELYGGNGDDELSGGDGFDMLFGGQGTDRMRPDGSGWFDAGVEQGDFVDGGDSINESGKQHNDQIYFNFLDTVDVNMGELGETGIYSGSYSITTTTKGKNRSTSTVTYDVEGEFQNINGVTGTDGDDSITGTSERDNLSGGDGEDFLYGMGGDDGLDGGIWSESVDHLYGGEGKDGMTGYNGDDYYEGGPGPDNISTRESHGHNTAAGFVSGEDTITIYNSNTCWEDLVITSIDADGDGVDDLRVEYTGKNHNKTYTGSMTLLDVSSVVPGDFNFEHDNGNYGGCL
jgi:Ca2+-binding RTX toxin-like protein